MAWTSGCREMEMKETAVSAALGKVLGNLDFGDVPAIAGALWSIVGALLS